MTEAVEAPKQHQFKLAPVGIDKKLLELGGVGGAAGFLLGILLIYSPVPHLSVAPQFRQMVIGALAFVAN